jgi:Dolichyl-phosphate-mannose-protein mannosyltransferase
MTPAFRNPIMPVGEKPVLWSAFCLSTATHAIYFALDHEHYSADTPSYLIPAANLLHGQGFVNALHQPELRRTPGYPLILAIFQARPLKLDYLIILQHALCVALAVAVAALILRFTTSRPAALLASLALSLDFATLRTANLLLSEITATVLIGLASWALYRAMTQPKKFLPAVVAGLLGGCTALVRPAAVLWFVPMSIYLFLALRSRALRPVLVLIASFLFLPALWTARNYFEAGYPGMSTVGAEDLLGYRAAATLAIQQPGDYLTNTLKMNNALGAQACRDLERTYQRDCQNITEAQWAAYCTHEGMKIILANPFSYLRSVLRGLAYTLFGGGAEALSSTTGLNPRAAAAVVLAQTVPELALVLAGCWYWYRKERTLFWLLILTVGYFLLISAGGEAYSRFRVPVMPMYALLIGGGVAQLMYAIKKLRIYGVAPAYPTANSV